MANSRDITITISADGSAAIAGIRGVGEATEKLGTRTTSFLDQAKQNWLAYTAGIYAAAASMQKMFDLAEKAAVYAESLETVNFLSSQYNVTGKEMVETVNRNSQGLVSLAAGAKIAADALAKGFTPQQVAMMATWAPAIDDFSASVNSSAEAMEMLEMALAKGHFGIRMLAGVMGGSFVDIEAKMGKMAKTMGTAEMQTATFNMVAERMAEIMKSGVGSVDSMADKMERFKNQVEELKITIGDYVIRTGAGLMATFQSVAALSLGLARVVMAPIQALMLATDYLGITKGKAEEYKIAMEAMADAGEDLAQKAAANFDLMKKGMQGGTTLAARGGNLGIGNGMKAAEEAAKEAKKLADEILRAERMIEAEVERIRARMLKNQMDAQVFMRKEDERLFEERAKGEEEYKKIVTEAQDWSVSEHQRAINKILSSEAANVARIYELWEAGTISIVQLEEGLAAVRGATTIAVEAQQVKLAEERLRLERDILSAKIAGFESVRAAAMESAANAPSGMSQYAGGVLDLAAIQGGVDPFSQRVEQMRQHYQDLELLYMQHKATIEQVEAAHNDWILAADQQTGVARLQTSLAYTNMSLGVLELANTLTQGKYKALFLVIRGMQAAQAIISANVAAAAALAPPPIGLGPVAGIPLAGVVKTMGYLNAAAIMAQGFMGTGSGGGGSAGGGGGVPALAAAATPVAQPVPSTIVNVHLYTQGSIGVDDESLNAFARKFVGPLSKAVEDGTRG